MDLFRSKYVAFLESELKRLREVEIPDLKKAHAAEMDRAIQENHKLFDELTKVRYVERPALRQVQIGEDKTPPPKPSEVPYGTPWQRVQRMYAAEQEAADRVQHLKPADAPVPTGGNKNGNDSERRDSASLSEPSKDA